jgi:hypothetical protein
MNPDKADEPAPDEVGRKLHELANGAEGAGPELRKRAAEAEEILHRMEWEVEQIGSDVRDLEKIEEQMRRNSST